MIQVRNLTKKYGSFTAVDNISFDIKRGHIYGFLGPNGAGKSTTMNMITGCLSATSGTVTVNGTDIFDDHIKAKRSIGYLPEQPPLYNDMTPLEYLEFVAEAKGIHAEKIEDQVCRAMVQTGITDVSDRLIRNLSKGYKQRVGIAQAILGDPEVVILDEPTVGLDPIQMIEVRELIRSLGKKHTVILSSHILSEISAVCDRVIVIAKGRIVASNSLSALTASYNGTNIIKIESRGEAAKIQSAIESIKGVISCRSRQSAGFVYTEIEAASDKDLREEVFAKFVQLKAPILSMNTNLLTLEDVFVKLTMDEEYESALPSGFIGESAAMEKNDISVDVADTESDDVVNSTDDDGGDYKPLFTWEGEDDDEGDL